MLRTGAGGAEGMEAFIYLCIYFTNLSYQNSNVNLVMNLVHFEQVTYTESGDDDTDLTALSSTSDGLMDNVHALRNTYAADLVSLITETLDNCGLAFRQFPVTAAFESSAFSVVKRSCAAGNLSFAHETAHNMVPVTIVQMQAVLPAKITDILCPILQTEVEIHGAQC
jgi:hypothetical protein